MTYRTLLYYNRIVKTQRNSSIELLKIFAMILICICHTLPFPTDGDGLFVTGTATTNVQHFFADCMGAAGLVGDVIFIVCSSYFLLDSKKIKIGKAVHMILNTLFISLVFMTVFLIIGFELGSFEIVKQIFPTVFQNNWFITYYIIFYLIHPLLNRVIRCLDKTALGIMASLLFVQTFILLLVQAKAPGINKLLCFVSIYFIVAYFKFYGQRFTQSKKLNIIVLISSVVLYYAMRIAVNFIGLKIYGNEECPLFALFHINNPIILAFALSLFNLANRKYFVSRPINFISSLSLLFYLIHHNNLFEKFVQPEWHDWFARQFGGNAIVGDMLLFSLILFSSGMLIAAIYKLTADRCTRFFADKVQIFVDNRLNKPSPPTAEN